MEKPLRKMKWNLVLMSGCLSRRSRSMTRYGMDGMLRLKESIVRKQWIDLVSVFVKKLEEIPDGCAECFPYELIDQLKAEYLSDG